MAFATDTARIATAATSDAPLVSLPSGIQSGDLLVLAWRGGRTSGRSNVAVPTGWNDLGLSSIFDYFRLMYRQADGAEGTTLQLSSTGGESWVSIAWRITNGDIPTSSSLSYIGSGVYDPANFNPAGAAQDLLWICGISGEDSGVAATSAPTNYSNLVGNQAGSGADGTFLWGASRQLNVDSEDPGAFSVTGFSGNVEVWTMAIPYLPPPPTPSPVPPISIPTMAAQPW